MADALRPCLACFYNRKLAYMYITPHDQNKNKSPFCSAYVNSGDVKAPQSYFLYDPKHAKLSVTQTRAHEKEEEDLYGEDSSLVGNHSPSLPPRRFL